MSMLKSAPYAAPISVIFTKLDRNLPSLQLVRNSINHIPNIVNAIIPTQIQADMDRCFHHSDVITILERKGTSPRRAKPIPPIFANNQ